MTFTHIIMTRFNLATPGRESALRNRPGWLESRFEMFERWCLPSVAAQKQQNFRWIVYFDENTPEEFKARVERLRQTVDFLPYYTGLFPAEGWRVSVLESFAPATPLLLTTRLDNDDALACDFTARLHAAVAAAGAAPGAYNFTNGLIRSGSRLLAIRHPSNAFFSWLEPVSPALRTAPSIQHMKIAAEGPVVQIGGAPAWMQVVHESNVSNKSRGWRVPASAAAGRFPDALTDGLNDSTARRLAGNLLLWPLQEGRDRLLALVRRG